MSGAGRHVEIRCRQGLRDLHGRWWWLSTCCHCHTWDSDGGMLVTACLRKTCADMLPARDVGLESGQLLSGGGGHCRFLSLRSWGVGRPRVVVNACYRRIIGDYDGWNQGGRWTRADLGPAQDVGLGLGQLLPRGGGHPQIAVVEVVGPGRAESSRYCMLPVQRVGLRRRNYSGRWTKADLGPARDGGLGLGRLFSEAIEHVHTCCCKGLVVQHGQGGWLCACYWCRMWQPDS
jgi:hypothetical protein